MCREINIGINKEEVITVPRDTTHSLRDGRVWPQPSSPSHAPGLRSALQLPPALTPTTAAWGADFKCPCLIDKEDWVFQGLSSLPKVTGLVKDRALLETSLLTPTWALQWAREHVKENSIAIDPALWSRNKSGTDQILSLKKGLRVV